MNKMLMKQQIEDRILTLRGEQVLLDSDVAQFYGVETKRVNEAIKNNPDKFPDGYIIETNKQELIALRSKISTLKTKGRGEYTKYPPKAFTERGLYMLATILKSPRATEATLAIVETYAKIRELARVLDRLPDASKLAEQEKLAAEGGEIMSSILDDNLETTDTETSIEVNFAIMKVKHTVKRKKSA
ncbi:ORF6N domain-containing protein [Candidatus Saccharibacteria bacterium]|nr:ORF6N domain-containing protein [Candidatus Saccharibacteria bacterium]